MTSRHKYTKWLLLSGILLFLVLDILMIYKAYMAEVKQFNFKKQFILSDVFYQKNLELEPLNEIINFVENDRLPIGTKKLDSLLYQSTKNFNSFEKDLKQQLQKHNIYGQFNYALLITKLEIKTRQDSLISILDLESQNKYYVISGNPDSVNLNSPSNRIFFKFDNLKSTIYITAFVNFTNTKSYLLKKIKTEIIVALIMLLLFGLIAARGLATLKEQRQLNLMKTDFINNMTHELKTPLSTLNIVSKTLKTGNTEETEEIIRNQVKRLEDTIDKVMDLSALQNNKKSINKESVNIKQFISALEKGYLCQNAKLKVSLVNIDENKQVIADPFLLETAIRNLLDNAFKYSDQEVQLYVEIRNKQLEIMVEDKGKGIKKSDQKLIFEKFYRVPENNGLTIKGSGLGLYQVDLIAKAHGGKCIVESQINKGTKLTLKLPAE